MRLINKSDVLEMDDIELFNTFSTVQKIVRRRFQTGFIKPLNLTHEDENTMVSLYKKLAPYYGIDGEEIKKDVNIQAHQNTVIE